MLAISSSAGTRTANKFSLPNTGSQRATAFPSGLDRRLPRVAIEPHTAPRRGYPPVPALEEAA